MAQSSTDPAEPPSKPGFFRKIFGHHNRSTQLTSQRDELSTTDLTPTLTTTLEPENEPNASESTAVRPAASRQGSYRVVAGLPRAQTFRRQQSEQREHLAPVEQTPDERRAASVDHRSRGRTYSPQPHTLNDPRTSAPGHLGSSYVDDNAHLGYEPSLPIIPNDQEPVTGALAYRVADDAFTDIDHREARSVTDDAQSVSESHYDDIIADELDTKWILNLSMHFRDRSKREKFFVTYRQTRVRWRRVTISLDYRNPQPGSLEAELVHTRYQRDKIAKIYEAIRDSLVDIQFYSTVTNLKLETTNGRLFVHVVEDGNEIIHFPRVSEVRHLRCRHVEERDIAFEAHMSGFVYKVKVGDRLLIKKEIPSPDTVDEFLYEINALNALSGCPNVIDFYGLVVDEGGNHVTGLLIDFAHRGTLIDILYDARDNGLELPWAIREKWARQIVQGLEAIHESGFVQGDFTLSNIVINDGDDAKIIDINRRGCPVGWEPPEAATLIEAGHRVAMYIGVKSDLYQLGMVLWAMAVLEDEPEARGRPLMLGPEDRVPDWYRQLTEICLSPDPRSRLQATLLLQMFPALGDASESYHRPQRMRSLEAYERSRSPSEERVSGARPLSDWSYVSRPYTDTSIDHSRSYYPPRGRSPPTPLPSDSQFGSPRKLYSHEAWQDDGYVPRSHSYADSAAWEAQQASKDRASKLDLDYVLKPQTSEGILVPNPSDLPNPETHTINLQDSEHTAVPSPVPQPVPQPVLTTSPAPDTQGEQLPESIHSPAMDSVEAPSKRVTTVRDESTLRPETTSTKVYQSPSSEAREDVSAPTERLAIRSESHHSTPSQPPTGTEGNGVTQEPALTSTTLLASKNSSLPADHLLSGRTNSNSAPVTPDPIAGSMFAEQQAKPNSDGVVTPTSKFADASCRYATSPVGRNYVPDYLSGIGDCHSYTSGPERINEKGLLDEELSFPGHRDTLPQMISTDAQR